MAEFDEGGTAEVDGIDTKKAGAFDEGGVFVFGRDAAQPGADGGAAGDEFGLSLLIPEASQIADEER